MVYANGSHAEHAIDADDDGAESMHDIEMT